MDHGSSDNSLYIHYIYVIMSEQCPTHQLAAVVARLVVLLHLSLYHHFKHAVRSEESGLCPLAVRDQILDLFGDLLAIGLALCL